MEPKEKTAAEIEYEAQYWQDIEADFWEDEEDWITPEPSEED